MVVVLFLFLATRAYYYTELSDRNTQYEKGEWVSRYQVDYPFKDQAMWYAIITIVLFNIGILLLIYSGKGT